MRVRILVLGIITSSLFFSCKVETKKDLKSDTEVSVKTPIVKSKIEVNSDSIYQNRLKYKREEIKSYFEDAKIGDTPISHFLNHPKVNKLVVNFCGGKFNLSDDDRTFELLDVLTAGSGELAPFYYYCFSYICSKSDGALAEVLGQYGQQFILNNSSFSINNFGGAPMRFVEHEFTLFTNWEDEFKLFSDSLKQLNSGKVESHVIDNYLIEIKEGIVATIELDSD